MKRWIFSIIGVLLLGTLVWAGVFYWQHLRGVWPAITPPDGDIVALLNADPGPGENTTSFPLVLPDGVSISVFAEGFAKPRDLIFAPDGTLLVSDPKAGAVYALPDSDADGKADRNVPLVIDLNAPHGVEFLCDENSCFVYVAETDGVSRYPFDADTNQITGRAEFLFALPGGGGHSTRSLLFRHNGELLTTVGSSCNVCDEDDWRRATVLVSDADGANLRVFASGLRNSVFLAPHPSTSDVWGSEMGRDLLGDDLPPDEVNILYEGRDYGWPRCYGQNVADVDFLGTEAEGVCDESIPAHIDVTPAHSAPLGLAFFPEEGWPKKYHSDLLVAYHGSWNRSEPTGYTLVRYDLGADRHAVRVNDFISGWLVDGNETLGRPVDVLFADDGTLYVSDDGAGVVYRVLYNEKELF